MTVATGDVRIRVRDVMTAASKVLNIPRETLRAGYGPHVAARQLAMALAVELTDKTLVDIAFVFGCDHTTIHHAQVRVRGRLRDDAELRAKADRIRVEAAISAARFIETMRRAALPQANQQRSA